jgi:hypothetical protein
MLSEIGFAVHGIMQFCIAPFAQDTPLTPLPNRNIMLLQILLHQIYQSFIDEKLDV